MAAEAGSVLLIQFARAPLEGRVKTRMIPSLSPAKACALHCELVLWTCRQLVESCYGDMELSVAGDAAHPVFEHCLALGISRVSQQCGVDLGERMYHAIHRGLKQYAKVILVGSDCPGINPLYIRRAILALDRAPVVLGPAKDGGYVLIGARKIEEQVFKGIPWGTAQVYEKTLVRLRQVGLGWLALPALADVDRPEDLPAWEALKAGGHCVDEIPALPARPDL